MAESNSIIGLTLTGVTVSSPTAANGGCIAMKSTLLTATLTMNTVTITNPAASVSGGAILAEGLNVVIQSTTTVTLNNAKANGDKGGAIGLFNTGTSSISFSTLSLVTPGAATSGGILYSQGTDVTITISSFNVDTTIATSGNGGGFCLENTGTTTISLTSTGSNGVTTYTRAS